MAKRARATHRGSGPKSALKPRRLLNVRLAPRLYQAIEDIARDERRSVPQAALSLVEEGLRRGAGHRMVAQSVPPSEIAHLAIAGGSFDWLEDEPDRYDDTSGEAV